MSEDQRLGSLVSIYKSRFGETASVIWDCGTRDGDDAAYLAAELQAKKVIAIDANPIAVERTKNKYPHFRVIHTAITNYDGLTSFDMIQSQRKDYAGSSSIIRVQHFAGASYHTITVSANRMDTLIKGLEPIDLDLVKVDIEGFTYEFLEGMGEHLKRVKVFHLETEKIQRHKGHKTSSEVKAFMEKAGFELVEVSYEWGPFIEDQIWVNPTLAIN